MTFPEQVKSFLLSVIHAMSEDPCRFAENPGTDFSRERKLGFENILRLIVSMESGTIAHELLKYFGYGPGTASGSAFHQQRAKLRTEVFQYLLFQFTSHFPFEKYKGKYQLVACDGSSFNIARNPDDLDTFHPPSGKSTKGYNMVHAVALYDILSKRYLDCVVQPGRKKNEFQAICDLVCRYRYNGIPIFIADRGFSCYNFFAHASELGWYFVVRAKDVNVRRILGMETLPAHIDSEVSIILTRSFSKKQRKHPESEELYRYVGSQGTFDFLPPGSMDEYLLSLRIVRFEVTRGVYENIITNLPANEFSIEEIKQLYHLRWNIETSFRDLKHTIGATYFRSKKVKCIEQEIWARLILFNFCAIVTTHVVLTNRDAKHEYQVNFAMAVKICHHFLRIGTEKPPPDVECLIGRYVLPIRHGRTYVRQHRFQLPASFCYRFS